MSLFDETILRSLIREELRGVIREELGRAPARAGEYVSVREAARVAGVAPQTIRVWMKAGRLSECHAGRVLRVRRAELEHLMTDGAPVTSAAPTDLTPEQHADRLLRCRKRPPGG